jgi:uncharacterized membrane protein
VTLASALVSGYLSLARALGEAAVCGPSNGCETVASSEYSAVLGIPVAFLGFGLSLVLLVLAGLWWLRRERRALLAAYGLLLLATLGVAYLTYLEVFVIEAICPWCVTYAVTVVASLVTAGLALRASSRDPEPAAAPGPPGAG